MFNSTNNKLFAVLIKEKPSYWIVSAVLSCLSAIFNLVSVIFPVAILLSLNQQFVFRDRLSLIERFLSIEDGVNGNNFIRLLVVFCLTICLKNCCAYLANIIELKHKSWLNCQLKTQTMSLFCNLNPGRLQQNKISNILLKLNREIDRSVLNIISYQKFYTLSTIVLIFIGLLLFISWQLTIICACLVWLCYRLNNWAIAQNQIAAKLSTQQSQVYARQVVEFLTGIKFIKAVAREKSKLAALDLTLQTKAELQFNERALAAVFKPLTELAGLLIAVCLFFAADYIYALPIEQTAPIVLVYLLVLWRLFPVVTHLNHVRQQFSLTTVSLKTISTFIQKTQRELTASGNLWLDKRCPEIEFNAVTFAYPNHGQIILDKVSFKASKGLNTAVVGLSIVEKSALIELVMRFHEPIDGKIMLNRQNIKEYNLPDLRRSCAIINSDIFIFHDSLRYNLSYGLDNITEAKLNQAITQVGLGEFLAQLREGLATIIGGNISLDNLQKQKLAIARAQLRDPALVIVDETSMSQDVLAQPEIMQGIAQLCRDRTTITITNRLKTIKNAAQIVFCDRGTVIEAGTHQELLHQGDFYHRWYAQQFRSSHQSDRSKLVQKIAKKLARHTNSQLSVAISKNVDELLSYVHLIHGGVFTDEVEEAKMLDESYQSAKDMLASLREYERNIAQKLDEPS